MLWFETVGQPGLPTLYCISSCLNAHKKNFSLDSCYASIENGNIWIAHSFGKKSPGANIAHGGTHPADGPKLYNPAAHCSHTQHKHNLQTHFSGCCLPEVSNIQNLRQCFSFCLVPCGTWNHNLKPHFTMLLSRTKSKDCDSAFFLASNNMVLYGCRLAACSDVGQCRV